MAKTRIGQGEGGVGATVLAHENLVVQSASLQARHDLADLRPEDIGFVVNRDHDRKTGCRDIADHTLGLRATVRSRAGYVTRRAQTARSLRCVWKAKKR